MSDCIICGKALKGRQTKFCSRLCKNKHTNYHHQSYLAQQRRGLERKLELVKIKGGCCERCGYSKNLAALEFHHLDPVEKEMQLDMRALSNRNWDIVLAEAEKCILLCSNCHAEEHNPDANLSA